MRKCIHGNMNKGQFSKGWSMSYVHLPESIRPKAAGFTPNGRDGLDVGQFGHNYLSSCLPRNMKFTP